MPADGIGLGRALSCAFPLADGRVSAQQAFVDVRSGSAFITPRPGAISAINGDPLSHPKEIRDGDWLSLVPGHLLRVRVEPRPRPMWRVQVDGELVELVGGVSRGVGAAAVSVSEDGRLLLAASAPPTAPALSLPTDGRPWALSVGDVLQLSDGVTLSVLSGPPPSQPPLPLHADARVRWGSPEHGIALSADGRLGLRYGDGWRSVQLVEPALGLTRALFDSEQGTVPAASHPADAVPALREQLVHAGVDGFALVVVSSGWVRLAIDDDAPRVRDAAVPAPDALRVDAWWLCGDDGTRLCVRPAGVLMGRHDECDLRFSPLYVHRHHALLHETTEGLVFRPLGRHPVYVDGQASHKPVVVSEGTELRVVPEQRMWIERRPVQARRVPGFQLALDNGTLRTVCRGRVRLGRLLLVGFPGRLYALGEQGWVHNGQPVGPQKLVRLAAGDQLEAPSPVTVASIAPGEPPLMRQLMMQPFAGVGRIIVRLSDDTQRRALLGGRLFTLLQLLVEAAVGSRLRGVIQTQPSDEDYITDDDLPSGAMRVHDLRLEFGARRLSRAAVSRLVEELQAVLVHSDLSGDLVEQGPRWVRLILPGECNVDLYR